MSVIKLHNKDVLNFLFSIEDNSVDLVITSPPYNKNGFRGRRDTSKGKGRWQNSDIMYDTYNDDMPEDEYQVWQIQILDELYRIIKPSGSILYNHKERRANNEVIHPLSWCLKSKAKYWQEIIWNRLSGVDHNINYLCPINEIILWFVKDNPKVFKHGDDTTIWDIPPKPEAKHPAPFARRLVQKSVLMCTEKNDVVLDPFMGIGTVGKVCKRLDRNFIGNDISKKYYDLAHGSIFQEQGELF